MEKNKVNGKEVSCYEIKFTIIIVQLCVLTCHVRVSGNVGVTLAKEWP